MQNKKTTAAKDAKPLPIGFQPVPLGTYSYEQEGVATWGVRYTSEKNCGGATLLDVSGVSSAAANGQIVVQLNQVVCFSDPFSLSEPINVVATPRSGGPFFVTTTYSLVYSGEYATDLQITLYGWNTDGTPAPNVVFDWRCRVVFEPIVF